MRSRRLSRSASRLAGVAAARSSITRSIAEIAKVTPLALMHCRSNGDSRRAFLLRLADELRA